MACYFQHINNTIDENPSMLESFSEGMQTLMNKTDSLADQMADGQEIVSIHQCLSG